MKKQRFCCGVGSPAKNRGFANPEYLLTLAFVGIVLAILIPNIAKAGLKVALIKTAIGIGIFLSPFIALYLFVLVLEWFRNRFPKKEPVEPELEKPKEDLKT